MLNYPKIYFFLLFFISDLSHASAWLLSEKKYEFILQTEYKTLATIFKDPEDQELYVSRLFYLEYNDLFFRYAKSKKINFGFEIKWYDYIGSEGIYDIDTSDYDLYQQNEIRIHDNLAKYSNQPLETQFFMQKLFLHGDHFSTSIKPNLTFYRNSSRSSVGISLLYGYGFKINTRNIFIDIEIGADVYKGTEISEKYDISVGFDLTKKYMLLIQSFNRENSNYYYEFSHEDDHYNNLKMSIIYKINDYLSVQSGYVTNISQRENYINESYITSIELRF